MQDVWHGVQNMNEEYLWEEKMLSDGTKAFLKFMAVLIGIAYAFQFYTDWSAEKEEKTRRASLTAEQRAMEDSAVAQENERQRKIKAAAEREKPFISACRNKLVGSLHDPMSAKIDYVVGWFANDGVYTGAFEGRAKNLFGAYVLAQWHCTAIGSDSGGIAVLDIKQLQR